MSICIPLLKIDGRILYFPVHIDKIRAMAWNNGPNQPGPDSRLDSGRVYGFLHPSRIRPSARPQRGGAVLPNRSLNFKTAYACTKAGLEFYTYRSIYKLWN